MNRPELDGFDPELVDAVLGFETTIEIALAAEQFAEVRQSTRDGDWDLLTIYGATAGGMKVLEIRHIDRGEGGWMFKGSYRPWRDVRGLRLENLVLRDDSAWSIVADDPAIEVYSTDEDRLIRFMAVALGRAGA